MTTINLSRRCRPQLPAAGLLLLLSFVSGAFATSIPIPGVTATTTMGECCGAPLVNIVNGSGLSSYDPSALHEAGFNWIAIAKTGTVTFTLPGSYLLDGVAIWNTSFGVHDFTLETSDDGLSYIPIPGFAGSLANVPNGLTTSEIFTFGPLQASYVRMVISSGYSIGNGSGLKEVMFLEAAPVPEPGTVGLLGFALCGIAVMARRRKRQQSH